MNEGAGVFARFFIALIPMLLCVWAYRAVNRRRHAAMVMVEDEPGGVTYRVFTHEFDREVSGPDLPPLLNGMTSDRARGWTSVDDEPWAAQVAVAEGIWAGSAPSARTVAHLADLLHRDRRDWALSLLIDMSGSMKGEPIAHVAAHARWLCNALHDAGVPVA